MNTKIIKLDINKKMFETITAKQGDTKSRFILFNLYDGPIQFDLTGRTVRVYGKKKDNTTIFNDLVITDAKKGYCTLELTNQMLAVEGMNELELVIFEGEKRLSTMPFILNVIGSKYSEDAIVSTNEFTALMNALKTVQGIDNKAEKAEVEKLSSQLEQKANKIFLTPEEFGAIGDGLTDDSEAMTLCFAKAKELNVNIKFLPNKTYIINDTIIIDFSTVVDCSNSLIKTKSADDEKYLFDIYNANGVVVKNIKVCSSIDKTPYLDVRNNNTTEALGSNVYAIYVRYSENVIIENVILDSITGLGGHNSKNVTIKNYSGTNLEMPVYFGNIDKMNIDGFHINFNNTGLSGYYHGFYLNHNITNTKIENGEIENIYNPIISDCFNFLTSAGAIEGDNIKDIKVNNVKCKGNFKQLTRLGECSTAYFDNIIFNSDTCVNLVEHCKGAINQRCEFSNSRFTCGNIGADDRGLVKEGYSYEVDFSTKFFNCDFYIKTSTGFNTIMKPRVNVELDYCRLIIDGDFKEFNCFNASANLISKYVIKNCKIKIVGDKKTILGVGDYSLENTTLKVINTEIDGNCNGGYACYNTGGVLINNTFYKARNIISTDSNCITNNNFIVEIIK